ncbi:hypothetical protein PoB_004495600 [Plakobranchus ocellatus]|uniref:NrS-1 polymerase-like helicase domain-containing protein n=1 Tax=Plakobranchus ocellatus TaxID=259542 RepID=A0AAV4BHU5_9GAST|nr:hypothetical protein PoB_004495600 [Plakobranchus ocellatus]
MDKFIATCNKTLHHLVITPAKYKVAKAHLYQPMKPILDRDGNVRLHAKYNFPMSTAIQEDDRLNVVACKWLTPASVMQELEPTPKLLVNKLKDFMNTSEVALFNHEPVKEPHAFCNFRKPEHLHVILHSTQPNLRDIPKYRGIERLLKINDCDLYTRKVISNEAKVFSYCINDKDKVFLGSNSKELLYQLNAVHGASNSDPLDPADCETVRSTSIDVAVPSTPRMPAINARKRSYMQQSIDTTSQDCDDDHPSAAKYMCDDGHMPQKRSKALQNLDTVKAALTKYPYCASFSDLVTACRGTPMYDNICSIYLDHRADKIWNLAREELVNTDDDMDLYRYLHEIPDELKNTMTPMQTLALFNSWCEQQINAKHLAWFIISRLQNRAYKRIGLYLQGASNSGKTYWTSTLFSPFGALLGKMTTGGRFCLQDCERKKIIIGEEIGITMDNIDRIKELMSGEVTTCERKGRSVVRCKASLVLLNSNNLPAFNVQHERLALMNRLYLVRNLKPSQVLPTALKHMASCKPHPKFLALLSPPTDEQLHMLDANRISSIFEPAITTTGMDLRFQSSWEDWLIDLIHGPLQLEEINKDVQLDWFLSQSPELPDVGPLHQHQGRASSPHVPEMVPFDDGIHEVQWVDPYDAQTLSPKSSLLYQNQMQDPINQQMEQQPPPIEIPLVVAAEPPTQEDKITLELFDDEPISKRLTVLSNPFNPPSIPKTTAYLPATEFGYTGDMQLIHECCSKEYGTTIRFIADINTTKGVHLMSVKIPPMIKRTQRIKRLEMNVTEYLYILQHNNDTYIRTITGVQYMPKLPAFYTDTISEEEEMDLAQLFIMLANLPFSCTPYYKLFIPNGAIRPMNIIQWPNQDGRVANKYFSSFHS